MLVSLTDKVVMVTGSARRVGRAILLAFAREGAHVIIHHSHSDADAASAAEEARAFGVKALIVKGDYSDPAQINANFNEVISHFGRLDILVNSASIFEKADLLDITPSDWRHVLDINLNAPFYASTVAAQLMRDFGIPGSILNIADNSGVSPVADRPHHSVSKAGLIHLTKTAALALAPYQIRVNALVLGPVLPEPGRSMESWAKSAAKLPLKRAGTPDDAARAALFLATNDFITGAILHVDGGEALITGGLA